MTPSVLHEAAERGADLGDVAWWADPRTEQPPGPPGTWLVSQGADAGIAIGCIDRGVYVPYDRYESAGLAADALVHLTTTPIRGRVIGAISWRAAISAAETLHAQVQSGADLGPVPAGVGLDRFGPVSGDSLFGARTPWPLRASPPPDLNLPYSTWVTVEELPPWSSYGIAAAAFGQPGGGLLVRMRRSVRWLYDAGFLDLVVPTEDDPE